MSTHPAKRVRFARVPAPPAPPSGPVGAAAPVSRAARAPAAPPKWPPKEGDPSTPALEIYRDLAAIDPEYRTPACLIDILVNAASRHPEIADEVSQLSQLMRKQQKPAPVPATQPTKRTGAASTDSAKCRQPRTAEARAVSPATSKLRSVPMPAPSPPPPTPAVAVAGAKRKRVVARDKDFTPYLREMEDSLGWDGRYDRCSDRAEYDASIDVGHRLESVTASIAKQLQKDDATYATKRSGATVIRDILHAVFLTQGRMGRELRNCLWGPDGDLVKALKTFTDEELVWLLDEDNGAWLRELDEVVHESNGYGLGDGLRAAKAMCLGLKIPDEN